MTRFVLCWLLSATLISCVIGDYAYKRPVTYAGPIVYSDEKPPVIHFPGPPPANTYNKQSAYGGSGYGGDKSSITYVPLPLDDLPILIYQSKDKPPVHVLNRPSKQYGGSSASYGGGSGADNYYSGNSYGASPNSYGYTSGSNYATPSASYGVGGSGGYSSIGAYPSSYGAVAPPAPKPYYVGKPASPTVYLPQVKPNSYSYGAGSYGGYSGGSGSNYGNSYSNPGYSSGGGYSYNSAAGGYSGQSQGSYYSGPTKQQPPHIVYSGHPPIHVYQQPNPQTTYSQQSSYGSAYNKPQSYANTYAQPPPPPPKQQPNYVPAPPSYHKPPIIIYQGVKPPVHVYDESSSSSAPASSYSAGSASGVSYSGTVSGGYGGGYSSKNGEQWEPVNTAVQEDEQRPSEVKVVTFAAGDKEDQEVVVVPEQSLDLSTEADQPQQKQETTA